MTIFDSTLTPVKTARPFGRGILASKPTHRADHTASDAAWWAAECARAENAHYDAMAAESRAVGLMGAGIACF